jgi:hypothetical protein
MWALRVQTPAKVAEATLRRQPGFARRCGDRMNLCRLDSQGITGACQRQWGRDRGRPCASNRRGGHDHRVLGVRGGR